MKECGHPVIAKRKIELATTREPCLATLKIEQRVPGRGKTAMAVEDGEGAEEGRIQRRQGNERPQWRRQDGR